MPLNASRTLIRGLQRRPLARRSRSAGSTMIEVLIAIVLLSFGMLGVAALEIAAVRLSHLSAVQTIADAQARGVLERLRRNPAGVAAGAYNSVALNSLPSDPGCSTSSCDASDMAQSDIAQWEADNARLLPGGTGSVSGNGTGSTFTVTLAWNENSPTGPIARTWVVTAQP